MADEALLDDGHANNDDDDDAFVGVATETPLEALFVTAAAVVALVTLLALAVAMATGTCCESWLGMGERSPGALTLCSTSLRSRDAVAEMLPHLLLCPSSASRCLPAPDNAVAAPSSLSG